MFQYTIFVNYKLQSCHWAPVTFILPIPMFILLLFLLFLVSLVEFEVLTPLALYLIQARHDSKPLPPSLFTTCFPDVINPFISLSPYSQCGLLIFVSFLLKLHVQPIVMSLLIRTIRYIRFCRPYRHKSRCFVLYNTPNANLLWFKYFIGHFLTEIESPAAI